MIYVLVLAICTTANCVTLSNKGEPFVRLDECIDHADKLNAKAKVERGPNIPFWDCQEELETKK